MSKSVFHLKSQNFSGNSKCWVCLSLVHFTWMHMFDFFFLNLNKRGDFWNNSHGQTEIENWKCEIFRGKLQSFCTFYCLEGQKQKQKLWNAGHKNHVSIKQFGSVKFSSVHVRILILASPLSCRWWPLRSLTWLKLLTHLSDIKRWS